MNNFDNDGFTTCPKCNGSFYDPDDIKFNARIKAKEYADVDVLRRRNFKDEDSYMAAFDDYADNNWANFTYYVNFKDFPCRLCGGTGKVDWITNCMYK